MEVKRYHYTNDFGFLKRLNVYVSEEKNGKYPVTVWEMAHGEFCGSGEMTRKEINDYLAHYGVTETF